MAVGIRKEYTWDDKWGVERNGEGFVQLVATNVSQRERKRVGKLLVAMLNGELIVIDINKATNSSQGTPFTFENVNRPGGVAALATEITGKGLKKKRAK